ncbi:MAG: ATP-binding cassette domain-containing protein [Planctomycetota bacterium]
MWYDGEKKRFLMPRERGVGFLFQDYALFPHLNVGQNIAYGLRGIDHRQRTTVVNELLERFQLHGLMDRYPNQISGGQQQRVAARAFTCAQPRLLLLDEPLSALDEGNPRRDPKPTSTLTLRIQHPVLLVAHDPAEALSLSDRRIVVMTSGRVAQQGGPWKRSSRSPEGCGGRAHRRC